MNEDALTPNDVARVLDENPDLKEQAARVDPADLPEAVAEGLEQVFADDAAFRAGRKMAEDVAQVAGPVPAPDATLKEKIRDIQQLAPCGGSFFVMWNSGPAKGMPLHMYCAEPFCLETGYCTGPKLVPGPLQFTHVEANDPRNQRRKVTVEEIMAGVELGNERVYRITKVRDTRSRKEIAQYIGMTWARMKTAFGRDGGWGQ